MRFVNINVTGFDAAKHAGLPVLGDARVALESWPTRWRAGGAQTSGSARRPTPSAAWAEEVARLVGPPPDGGLPVPGARSSAR